MRGVIKAIAAAAVLATVMAPGRARAEGYVSPFAGVHFGNDEIEKKFVWGADAGYMASARRTLTIRLGRTSRSCGFWFGRAMPSILLGVLQC